MLSGELIADPLADTATGDPRGLPFTVNVTVAALALMAPEVGPVAVTWAVNVGVSPMVADCSDAKMEVDVGSVVTVKLEVVELLVSVALPA